MGKTAPKRCPQCKSTRVTVVNGTQFRCKRCDFLTDIAVNPTVLEFKTYKRRE